MNKEVGILSLSYGDYVSLDDYMKLQNNRNELKKWLEFMIKQEREGKTVYISLKDILNKMQELEQGKDE